MDRVGMSAGPRSAVGVRRLTRADAHKHTYDGGAYVASHRNAHRHARAYCYARTRTYRHAGAQAHPYAGDRTYRHAGDRTYRHAGDRTHCDSNP